MVCEWVCVGVWGVGVCVCVYETLGNNPYLNIRALVLMDHVLPDLHKSMQVC